MELSRNKTNLKWVILIIIFSYSLYSFINKDLSKQKTSVVDQVFIGMIAPLQKGLNKGEDFFNVLWNVYIFNIDASRQNTSFRKKISELDDQIFNLNQLKRENERLRSLLKYSNLNNFKSIVAEISGRDVNSINKMIRINKGEKSGIVVESPVFTPEGLVGFVYQVYQNYSDVITILDSSSRVEVLAQKSRSHGILEGVSSDHCLIKYVDQDEDVELNDVVVTSGLGNIYPKGIKVGKIVKIEKESFGIIQKLMLNPSVNFNKLEEVIVGVRNAK